MEEFDFQKGIELASGRMGEVNIERLTFFGNGIVVDTRSSTEDSEKVILDLLDFARDAFGATAKINRRLLLSQIIFHSEMKLSSLHPILEPIAERLGKGVSADLNPTFSFEPIAVLLNVDTSQNKLNPGVFSIERKVESPFSENTLLFECACAYG